MSRTRKNPLTLAPVFGPDGTTVTGYRLFGYCNGKQIRRQGGPDALAEFEEQKRTLEERAQRLALLEASKPQLVATYLTPEQIKDAQAAFRLISGRNCTLLEAVTAGVSITGTTGAKDASEAAEEYLAYITKRNLSRFTITTNGTRIRSFLKFTGVKLLGEISPAMVENYVTHETPNLVSQLSRGRPICTWLNWCCEKRHGVTQSSYLRETPFKMNMKELSEIASRDSLGKKKMLSAAQCEALLKAAIEYDGGEMVPFTILSLWCYMRAADTVRTKREFIHLDLESSIEGPFIEAHGHKRGSKSRSIVIPENVRPLLRQCIERGIVRKNWWLKPGDKLTPELAKRHAQTGDIPFWQVGWDNIRANAGLITLSERQKEHRDWTVIVETEWQHNILRHTGESYAIRRTDDVARVTKSAGHSKSTAYKHYICVPKPGDTDKFYNIRLELPAVVEHIESRELIA